MDADIVDRLRDSVRACRALDRSALLAEAAAEIERLRNGNVNRCETVALTDAKRTSPQPYEKPDEKQGVCDTGSLPPEWLARPYWVDPPSGWRYGFPRLYDPAADGDMTEWMIAQGYPEQLARQGLACTFTAADDH